MNFLKAQTQSSILKKRISFHSQNFMELSQFLSKIAIKTDKFPHCNILRHCLFSCHSLIVVENGNILLTFPSSGNNVSGHKGEYLGCCFRLNMWDKTRWLILKHLSAALWQMTSPPKGPGKNVKGLSTLKPIDTTTKSAKPVRVLINNDRACSSEPCRVINSICDLRNS